MPRCWHPEEREAVRFWESDLVNGAPPPQSTAYRPNSGDTGQLILIVFGCLVAGSLVYVVSFVLKEYGWTWQKVQTADNPSGSQA